MSPQKLGIHRMHSGLHQDMRRLKIADSDDGNNRVIHIYRGNFVLFSFCKCQLRGFAFETEHL